MGRVSFMGRGGFEVSQARTCLYSSSVMVSYGI